MDELPAALRKRVAAVIEAHPPAAEVFLDVVEHLTLNKKRKPAKKTGPGAAAQTTLVLQPPGTPPDVLSPHRLQYKCAIAKEETIFELANLSFLAPARRRLLMLFHIYLANNAPQPVLSVASPALGLPELSITGLADAVKLCMMFPILGHTTVPSKKDTVMMCLWLNEDAVPGVGPIICTVNLEAVKKQLMETGKIPPHAESLVAPATSTDAIEPIHELIVGFLERQFSLCGVPLHSLLPLSQNRFTMNEDLGVCISRAGPGAANDPVGNGNVLVMALAYKGSKEGSLMFFAVPGHAYLVFGFRKPVVLIPFAQIRDVSYKDITRFTFTVLVTCAGVSDEEVHEFSMVDQKLFQAIDEFVKRMNISDSSFSEQHREKRKTETEEPGNGAANEDDDGDDDEDETYSGAVEEASGGEGSSGSEDEDFNSGDESGLDSGLDDLGLEDEAVAETSD